VTRCIGGPSLSYTLLQDHKITRRVSRLGNDQLCVYSLLYHESKISSLNDYNVSNNKSVGCCMLTP